MITLGVIGIVAALTIPGLVQKYDKQTTIVKLKKAYSFLGNAGRMMMADTGCDDLECTGVFDGYNASDRTGAFFDKFQETAKVVPTKKFVNTGWVRFTPLHCEKQSCVASLGSASRDFFLMADGNAYLMEPANYAVVRYYAAGRDDNYDRARGILVAVVTKPQNLKQSGGSCILGRTCFRFLILENGKTAPVFANGEGVLVPMADDAQIIGHYGEDLGGFLNNEYVNWTTCNPNDSTTGFRNGYSCAARIMVDGWQIKY